MIKGHVGFREQWNSTIREGHGGEKDNKSGSECESGGSINVASERSGPGERGE
jgi:hypothetical protein